jgi:cation transport protein ChaC
MTAVIDPPPQGFFDMTTILSAQRRTGDDGWGGTMSSNSNVSSAYFDTFDPPKGVQWTREEIEESLNSALQSRPEPGPFWFFAYDSLIWHPLIEYDRLELATLHDWHRSFCLRLIESHATPQTPGRRLALEPGGVAHGTAFRVSEEKVLGELRKLWSREMRSGSYTPTWVSLNLRNGTAVTALTFAADPAHAQYCIDASVLTVAPLVGSAKGHDGSNADEVFLLEMALAKGGLSDPYVRDIANRLRRMGLSSAPISGNPS